MMYWVTLLLLISTQSGAAVNIGPDGLPATERENIALLMRRIVDVGRIEADAVRANHALSADDRRDAQSQFALILMTLGRCDDTVTFVQQRTEIKATGIERLISRADSMEDRPCAIQLASLMAGRTDDSYLTPEGQISRRYLAAAYLESVGDKKAKAEMAAAEAEMLSMPNPDTLWQSRWDALAVYGSTPRIMEYLEYLADRMAKEKYSPTSQKGRSLLVLLAGKGRCDLVERIMQAGPASCDEPRKRAEGIYINPRQLGNFAEIKKVMNGSMPSPTEQSLTDALAAPNPWVRFTKLLLLVTACKEALRTPRP